MGLGAMGGLTAFDRILGEGKNLEHEDALAPEMKKPLPADSDDE
jgi:hypothetical protein